MRRILVIEDEPDIRELIAISFELVGWEALLAASGAAGIEIARAERPDAILLDVMMPGLDGLQTLARLRLPEPTRGIPVVFLTAKAWGADGPDLDGYDASGVIEKPFDPAALPAEIARLLGWPAPAPARGPAAAAET